MITNSQSGTHVQEIAAGVFRINTPVPLPDGNLFSVNQYLVVDDEPLLFHSGPRQLFPLVSEAIASVMPVERLRYIGLSHVEADECGALNLFLAVAPLAMPLCGSIAAMVSMGDLRIARRALWQTARNSRSVTTRCAGSTRPIFRMAGNAG